MVRLRVSVRVVASVLTEALTEVLIEVCDLRFWRFCPFCAFAMMANTRTKFYRRMAGEVNTLFSAEERTNTAALAQYTETISKVATLTASALIPEVPAKLSSLYWDVKAKVMGSHHAHPDGEGKCGVLKHTFYSCSGSQGKQYDAFEP